jgi:hypothetical protein
MKITEHNTETGEITERNYTPEELAQNELDAQERETQLIEAEAKAATKAALLDRLGITADEAKLLLS